MTSRPTIHDLARETGLSVATIDRALNGRPNVSARAIARVADAAEKLGYYATGLAKFRADAATRPSRTLGFVLQKPNQEFYKNIARGFEAEVASRTEVRGRCLIRYPDTQDVDDYCRVIRDLAREVDAIAIVAPNHPKLTALIEELNVSGLPVYTLLNDLAEQSRRAYFGTDNLKVGRVAAWMLTTSIKHPGELAIFVGSGRWYGHMMRETGFQSYLRQHAPEFRLLDSIVTLDTRQVTYEATLDLLNRRPDVRGLYVAGGGMEGAIAALREARPPGRIGLVANELTAESRSALLDRYVSMVLSTPVEALCRQCVDAMINQDAEKTKTGQFFVGPELVAAETL